MKFKKIFPRNWNFQFAISGSHPDWAMNNARDFAILAQEVGIEPWIVFPGTRQVYIETHDEVTEYRANILAEKILKSELAKYVDRVWTAGSHLIYIDYIGKIDPEKVANTPDFKVGDTLRHLLSGELITILEVGSTYYTVKESSTYTHMVSKDVIKCEYKLK